MAATIICVKSKAKPSRQKKEIEKKNLLDERDGLIGDLSLNRA